MFRFLLGNLVVLVFFFVNGTTVSFWENRSIYYIYGLKASLKFIGFFNVHRCRKEVKKKKEMLKVEGFFVPAAPSIFGHS